MPDWSNVLKRRVTQLTPADLRVILRLAAFLVVWKLLSTDYSALPELVHGPELFPLPFPLACLSSFLKSLFAPRFMIFMLQAIAIASLTLFLERLQRLPLVIGILSVTLIEWCAYLYRCQLYQLDFPLALLAITAVYPVSASVLVKLVNWNQSHLARALRFLGTLLLIYVANCYFLAGLSKLIFDRDWCQNVELGCLLPFVKLGYLGDPPGWLAEIAYWQNAAFTRAPILSTGLAWFTLIAELTWPLVLFSQHCRRIIPTMMACVHVGIFLAGGPLFLSMAVLQTAIAVDWQRLGSWWRRSTRTPEDIIPCDALPRSTWGRCLGVLLVAALSLWPAWAGQSFFPFSNYCCFGWSYRTALAGMGNRTYALGYRDPNTGEVKPLPPNHGGFFDFRLHACSIPWIKRYCETSDEAERCRCLSSLQVFQTAVRGNESNQKWLGWLAHPDDLVLASHPIDLAAAKQVYLLRGCWALEAERLVIRWESLGRLPSHAMPQLNPTSSAPATTSEFPVATPASSY